MRGRSDRHVGIVLTSFLDAVLAPYRVVDRADPAAGTPLVAAAFVLAQEDPGTEPEPEPGSLRGRGRRGP